MSVLTTTPLAGRRVVITGVSRRAGIGHAIACRAAGMGASLLLHHYAPHDAEQPWGADSIEATLDSVRAHLQPGAVLADVSEDLRDAEAPARIIARARAALGGVDALVCNHASSGHDGRLEEITAADLDHHWRVNARASLLLLQAMAALPDDDALTDGRARRSAVLMSSGQILGPMADEIAYITSKAALAGATASLADGLADVGIRVNTVNPGPVNTGYMDEALERSLAPAFPGGVPARPEDPARLICWLLTDDAAWVTGQVISTEGGFRRWGL
ncbi:SDR family oxidoreductase [Actinomyces respiraculi]|uniref:SDR family oxidoreductase n=1 Tax=Actinomyces respiraculi TaxID=2744574 RepID=UPI0014214BB1|nr:SDR family oxidoreductase [Actinomyces respiraculi]